MAVSFKYLHLIHGPHGSSELEEVGKIVVDILQQKALCQQDPDQEEEDAIESEDQAEFDSVLISSAGDVVAAMANALGSDFQTALATCLPLIKKYYVSYQPSIYRQCQSLSSHRNVP